MIGNVIKGLTSYGAAVKHISKHKMWLYVLLPGLLSLLMAALVISSAIGFSDSLGALIDGFWKWDFGKSVVEKIAQIFGGLLILAVGAILFKQILMVVLAPFMSILSAKVEEQVTGNKTETPFSFNKMIADMLRGLRLAVRNAIRELFVTALLFLIGLVPIFTPFTTVLIFLLQSYYAGFGNTDFTLERHFNYRESIRFVRRNRGLTLGNGIIFMALFLSVIGFIIALPLGTVAATLHTTKKLEKYNI
ncbi:MAG: EI24 domain-containing protein [Bacteroidota bacterium]